MNMTDKIIPTYNPMSADEFTTITYLDETL